MADVKGDVQETAITVKAAPLEVKGTEPTELEAKIITRIEYYFGDINFTFDKFLIEESKKDDGWVPMETMVKFNRLKILSDDFCVIANALSKSKQQLMEISEDGLKIRRVLSKPLPEFTQERKDEWMNRSLFLPGSILDEYICDLEEEFQESLKDFCSTEKEQAATLNGIILVATTFVPWQCTTITMLKDIYEEQDGLVDNKVDTLLRQMDVVGRRFARDVINKIKKVGYKAFNLIPEMDEILVLDLYIDLLRNHLEVKELTVRNCEHEKEDIRDAIWPGRPFIFFYNKHYLKKTVATSSQTENIQPAAISGIDQVIREQ